MSGNTFGTLFAVTNFGESHGPAIGCVIDGCPPGMEPVGSRHPARPGPAPPRHQPPRHPAPGRRQGRNPLGRVRRTDHRHPHLPADPQHRPAQQGLLRDRPDVPPGPRRLHLPAEIRPARSARRRPGLGPAHGADGRRGRRGQEVAGGRSTARCFAAACSRSATCPLPSRAGTTCPTIRSSRRSPTSPSWRAYMDSLRKAGDSCGARIRVTAYGVPVGLGEPLFDKLDADIAYAMMGINAVKGVEIGAGFASVTPARHHPRRLAHAAAASRPTTPAACWAASAPGRTWRSRSRSSRPAPSSRPRETIDLKGEAARGGHQGPARPVRGHPRHPDRRGHAGPGGDGARAAPARAKWRCQSPHGAHRLVVSLALSGAGGRASSAVVRDSRNAGRIPDTLQRRSSARSTCQTVPAPQTSSRTAITGRSSRARSTTPSSAATCKGT